MLRVFGASSESVAGRRPQSARTRVASLPAYYCDELQKLANSLNSPRTAVKTDEVREYSRTAFVCYQTRAVEGTR